MLSIAWNVSRSEDPSDRALSLLSEDRCLGGRLSTVHSASKRSKPSTTSTAGCAADIAINSGMRRPSPIAFANSTWLVSESYFSGRSKVTHGYPLLQSGATVIGLSKRQYGTALPDSSAHNKRPSPGEGMGTCLLAGEAGRRGRSIPFEIRAS